MRTSPARSTMPLRAGTRVSGGASGAPCLACLDSVPFFRVDERGRMTGPTMLLPVSRRARNRHFRACFRRTGDGPYLPFFTPCQIFARGC